MIPNIICFVLFLSVAYSWGCKAHVLSIEVASTLVPSYDSILEQLSKSYIVKTHKPDLHSISSAVCLPDSIKREKAYRHTYPWHFYDIPYNYTHEHLPDSLFDLQSENIYSATRNELHTYLTSSNSEERGDALLFLLHFVGDMMQPLHVTELLSVEYPTGDAGGNKYSLYGIHGQKNLHMLSDNIGGLIHKRLKILSPLSTRLQQQCVANDWYGDEDLMINVEDYLEMWIRETHLRGERIYDILRGTNQPSTQQVHLIQEVLLEAMCRAAKVISVLMYNIGIMSEDIYY